MANSDQAIPPASAGVQATAKETRKIVTPYAFQVSPALLGQSLATPFRRFVAQCIDLPLLGLLSMSSSWILALIAALTFLKAGSHLRANPKRSAARGILRFFAMLLIAYIVVEAISTEEDKDYQQIFSYSQKVNGNLKERCGDNSGCLEKMTDGVDNPDTASDLSRAQQIESYQDLVKEVPLSEQQKRKLKALLDDANAVAPGVVQRLNRLDNAGQDNREDDTGIYRIYREVYDLISEFAHSFGWAALYYSVFTAWLGGVTPGKWVMGVKVVKLDGTSPTLWEAFGRYGGYCAGLATGLLGFVQLFWDPNRQAIQDKIAETLVINRRQLTSRTPTQKEQADYDI